MKLQLILFVFHFLENVPFSLSLNGKISVLNSNLHLQVFADISKNVLGNFFKLAQG